MSNLSRHISDWIKMYAKEANKTSLVIGVSGGVDSALASTLCAMTELTTYCVVLPIHQNKRHTELGHGHINWLSGKHDNVKQIDIDLSETFDIFKSHLISEFNNELAFANSKSRLRMVTLYQIAQSVNGLVVGTGNKIEDFGVGFFTKYGDGGVDISPIADLYKSEVYELAKSLGVSPDILNARPTDGLWGDDRTDEDQMGATYIELEWAMKIYESDDKDVSKLKGRERIVYDKFVSLHHNNKHKMVSIPTYKKNK